MNNIQGKINKLLLAIRKSDIDIKIDTIELYSDTTEKYFKLYKVYIKDFEINTNGEYDYRYIFQDEFVSKIDLLKYLAKKYKKIKEGEVNV